MFASVLTFPRRLLTLCCFIIQAKYSNILLLPISAITPTDDDVELNVYLGELFFLH